MDKLRDIRFITPPFFFLGSLLVGAWLDNQVSLETIGGLTPQAVVAIGGVVVAALFPLGFVIGGLSINCLRVMFYPFGKNYQISLSKEAWDRIWPTLELNSEMKRATNNEVDAAITFDHEILHQGIHDSNVRLWTAFNISSHSCVALILALLLGRYALCISWTGWWVWISSALFALFVLVAVVTWHEHMRMFEFQSQRLKEGRMPHHRHADLDLEKKKLEVEKLRLEVERIKQEDSRANGGSNDVA
jgi:hypothetical protein